MFCPSYEEISANEPYDDIAYLNVSFLLGFRKHFMKLLVSREHLKFQTTFTFGTKYRTILLNIKHASYVTSSFVVDRGNYNETKHNI